MIKIASRIAILCVVFACGSAKAGDIVIGAFSGLNSQDSSLTLNPSEATDILNVDITPGGKSVKKRKGFGLYKTLTLSTAPIHGGHFFQDLSGNNVQLWGGGARLNAIVGGATPVQISTGADTATWQCADAEGFAYCLNSSRDIAVKTDGTTANTSFQQGIPLGTMATFTPDRMVVAGVSGTPNTLFFSKANTYTTHTTGPLDSDAFTEPIAAKGSRITHVRYACGKVLWWKDTSFGYFLGTNQYVADVVTISPDIGTLDNSSDEYNGHVYFRGHDNHIYDYDCSNVVRLSRAIAPTVQASGRRKSNSWTQSSQAEFSAGLIIPEVNLSTRISVGDVTVSSFSASEYSSASGWGSGNSSNMAVGTSSITLSTNNSGSLTNSDFETGAPSAIPTGWTVSGSPATYTNDSGFSSGCVMSPQSGSNFLNSNDNTLDINKTWYLEIIDLNSTVLASLAFTKGTGCTWQNNTLTSSVNTGKRVKFRFKETSTGGTTYLTTFDSYIFGGSVSVYNAGTGSQFFQGFDNIQNGSSTITSGFFNSKAYDTSFTSSTFSVSQFTFSANTSTPTLSLETSRNSTGPFAVLLTTTGTNAVGNRYVRWSSTITIGSADTALTAISSITFLSRSTGTFYSAVNNAPSLSSWGAFTVTDSTSGAAGNITYYTRASSGAFTVGSSTPAWTLQTKNSAVNYSTGTYMQMRADFALGAATETPKLSDFMFNWMEGTASDKAYIKYFNDNVWVSVSSGTGGTNNQIQRWDLLNQTWLIDNIPANGMIVDSDVLYLGSPTDGKVHRFGGVNTDNAADILAFWKSKDFVGNDPFVKNEYISSDTLVKNSSGTLSVIYTVDSSSPTIKTINLYDTVRSIIKRSYNLPAGKVGGFYNVKFQDSSAFQWEVLGHRVRYNSLAWKVE